MSQYYDWQQRVIEERDALAAKIAALAAFTASRQFAALGEMERNLLHNQLNIMNSYHSILLCRMERFILPENEA